MSQLFLAVDPSAAARSQMADFARRASVVAGRDLADFAALHRWACDDGAAFWRLMLEWSGVQVSGEAEPARVGEAVDTARFFPSLRLNYARNLLRARAGTDGDAAAVVLRNETGGRRQLTWNALARVALTNASALRARGVGPGDRVAAFARNSIDAIEACLGAAAVGATWCSVAPDLGTEAVLGRFGQLEPTVLFAHTQQLQHGKMRGLEKQVGALADALPSLRALVIFDGPLPEVSRPGLEVVRYEDWCETTPLALESLEDFPFDHPLFVLFSSGTTGPPKCILHGAGGTLLEHVKEHRLHTDLGPRDRLYFHTSCGWMMWNWQLSALASGTPIVVYDGSPAFPDAAALLRMIDEERVTVFGTSPAYVQLLRESGVSPHEHGRFESLRAILSTGSILYDEQFDWIGDHLKAVPIHSISGGSDIIGCFVLGNPMLPVYRGESQSISVGIDVRVLTERGVEQAGTGELICVNAFPSRPVGIWNDPSGERFHDSYFAQNAGVWTHGDRVDITPQGSARILGRSDGTLKIRGVRIGPAELYSVVLAIPGIREAMAVEQKDPAEPGGSRLVLLVVMAPGRSLDRELTWRIKRELSQKASALHVPAVIATVSGLPQTLNGKYSERAARDIVNGLDPPNRQALRNPEVLDEMRAHPDLQPPARPGER